MGHFSRDITAFGDQLGGTVAYAGLTAYARGRKVGILTSCASNLDLQPLEGLAICRIPAQRSTTFENTQGETGRVQKILARADDITLKQMPQAWTGAEIVHLGPIADEVEFSLVQAFPASFLGLTPQGWLRQWDDEGQITGKDWRPLIPFLAEADAVVISEEDLDKHKETARALADHCKTLAVTLGPGGARVYHRGEERLIPVSRQEEVDATGAGDIFAATFFIHLLTSKNPWTSAEHANDAASRSVRARGLTGLGDQKNL